MLKFSQLITVVAVSLCVNGAVLAHQQHGHQHHGHNQAAHSGEIAFTRAEVVEVDAEHNEVVLRHEAIEHLNMPGMTMAFSLAEHIDVESLQNGEQIEVKVEQQETDFVIVELITADHHH